MGRKSNKQKDRSKKQRMFREGKKKVQRIRLHEATRIPSKQYQRWATDFAPLVPDAAETERDPDYVAFCIAKQLDAWDEFSFLWLRVAAALRLGLYAHKLIDRTGRVRPFKQDSFMKSIADGDLEHEQGLRYEADKFLTYLLYGGNPRFRELFGYVLLPSIKNDLANDLNIMDYNRWFAGEPTADLSRRLAEFDLAEVE